MAFFTHENQRKPHAYRKPNIYCELANVGASICVSNKRRPFTAALHNCRNGSDKIFLKTPERCDAKQTGVTILFIVVFWKVDVNNLPVFKN